MCKFGDNEGTRTITMAARKSKPTIGQTLRRAREAAGLSWYALAQRSGLSMQHVPRIERGESSPSIATLEKLAEGMNCNLLIEFVPKKN